MRKLSDIANEIIKDWRPVNFAAKPYLMAMKQLDSINDQYMYDSGKSIVATFLSNASSWRTEKAKEIKKELLAMLKGKITEGEETERTKEKQDKEKEALKDKQEKEQELARKKDFDDAEREREQKKKEAERKKKLGIR